MGHEDMREDSWQFDFDSMIRNGKLPKIQRFYIASINYVRLTIKGFRTSKNTD